MSHHVQAPIAFLTDFGLADGYVAVMKGIVLGVVPGRPLIDISHAVPPQQVATAAWVLATSYRYFPPGTVFVCVVDPGVGSQRLPVALRAGEWFFVGPDNGLFSYILQEQVVHEAVALTNAAYHRSEVSATFQGRDLFSPVAAHIAGGVVLTELGPPVQPVTLQRLDIAPPSIQNKQVSAQIVHVDHFGNLITNIPLHALPDLFEYAQVQLRFTGTGTVVSARRRFFADLSSATSATAAGNTAGGRSARESLPFLYVDSSGYIAVAVQNGSAADVLHLTTGERTILTYS